ncbi:peripherin-2-like isoform X2 [Ostrinia nubilalis]|uniref:peripherin-2-like n=1 Tax=Ostrinia furnacalis TaxID=93504 RepID=UPI00103AA621|nr:peripherin-2-like [Ostrinia furnacalis]
MKLAGPNHPFVVWAACLLWLTSMFAIAWSLLLFFCVGDILLMTGTDLVNAFVLLSGIIMLPTNVSMLCSVANSRKIDHKAKVVCCPLWLSIVWVIIINLTAAIICMIKIYSCRELTTKYLTNGMKQYRSVPKYKHFMDNLQWSLKCCGLNSYSDWFSHDWYDKIRDYEWDPSLERRNSIIKRSPLVADSVPLSCCKSGSCISNYLTELGTYSINTTGCGPLLYRIVMISMNGHLVMFLLIVIIEIIILKLITKKEKELGKVKCKRKTDVRHIMSVKDNFDASSGSCQLNPEDSDEVEQPILPD